MFCEMVVVILRWVDDDPQPGIVEAVFTDAEGRSHRVIDKTPYLALSDEYLGPDCQYPCQGSIRCAVVREWRDETGRLLAAVDVSKPWAIESTEGLSDFVVPQSQLRAVGEQPTPR